MGHPRVSLCSFCAAKSWTGDSIMYCSPCVLFNVDSVDGIVFLPEAFVAGTTLCSCADHPISTGRFLARVL